MANTHAQIGPELGLTGPGLLRSLAENWWLLLLRGFAAIAFGEFIGSAASFGPSHWRSAKEWRSPERSLGVS